MSYSVAVRTLCDFTAKRGDLDRRFTPGPTAQQGMLGHAIVAARRGADYQAEVSLRGEYGQLLVRGRADGYHATSHRIDECKTFRGDLARMPDNHRALHWAQLKTYGSLLCQRDGLASINLALVYFDIESQEETVLEEQVDAATLKHFFDQRCGAFSQWAEQELTHIAARNAALSQLAFPHVSFHSGQRTLAEGVYKAACTGRYLLAQAPTGIGKTVGTLFPMLKALSAQKLDKIFYLTAKSTGRQLALDGLQQLKTSTSAVPLRVLELVARDKACINPGRACQGDTCPLAKGFYDRLPRAREAAVACGVMDQGSLRAVAITHGVCPYYLSQEMVRWSDVVVGDYNYYFDYGGLLYGLTLENQWRVGLLVDEAHNLIERARQMHSASLSLRDLNAAHRCAPAPIKAALNRVTHQWSAFFNPQAEAYAVYEDPPNKLLLTLQAAVTRLNDHAAAECVPMPDDLQQFHFAALQFCRLAETFGEHSIFDATIAQSGEPLAATLCIRNLIPGVFLRKRFEDAHCAILFSATLCPRQFYQDMLGLPPQTQWLDVTSPFTPEQLSVHLVREVSTRYRHRQASLAPIVALMGRQFEREPGNYLVFVSSFDYLDRLAARFSARNADIPIWQQHRSMRESDRQHFIDRFTADGRGIGFAVLGGAFAEGIDLPGKRLIGAFIATLGLPQVNPVNDEIMKRMQAIFGTGYEYTYLYPGLQKVAQAAGRVIRTTSDSGTLYLIDDRFAQPQVRELLPRWWNVAQD